MENLCYIKNRAAIPIPTSPLASMLLPIKNSERNNLTRNYDFILQIVTVRKYQYSRKFGTRQHVPKSGRERGGADPPQAAPVSQSLEFHTETPPP